MLRHGVLSVIVGIVTAIVVVIVGLVLKEMGVAEVGGYIKGVAALLGLAAGVWYFLTGRNPSRM